MAPSSGESESVAASAKPEEMGVFSGWLMLLGSGLLIAPFLVLATIGTQNLPYLFDMTRLELFAAQPAALAVGRFELIANIIFFALLCGLNFLYFERKKAFPICMILYLILQVVLSGADYQQQRALQPSSLFPLYEVGSALLFAAISIPYLLVSRRVKATFVR